MNFIPAICPRCGEYIMCKINTPFLVCPLCKEVISTREGSEILDKHISEPKKLKENIAVLLSIDAQYGPELPYSVLALINEKFPYNEEVSWLLVRMSGFAPSQVTAYLTQFSEAKKQVPFAEEFLNEALVYRNMGNANLFETYIRNKLPASRQSRHMDKLNELKSAYVGKTPGKSAHIFLLAYYITCGVLNGALAVFFIFSHLNFYYYLLIGTAALFVEILILFLQYRKYGNRLDIKPNEKLLMTIFMCSLVVLVGGVFLGVTFR